MKEWIVKNVRALFVGATITELLIMAGYLGGASKYLSSENFSPLLMIMGILGLYKVVFAGFAV